MSNIQDRFSRPVLVIDAFCGGGGFSCGFKQVFPSATFIGIDKDLAACVTYERNIGHACCIDLSGQAAVDWLLQEIQHVIASLGDDVLVILIGSPPCQKFSGLNMRGNRTMDPSLIRVFFTLKATLKPKWWVMEESPFAAKFVEPVYRRFLQANWFGLYSERRRLFAGNYLAVKPRFQIHVKGMTVPPIRHPAITAEEVKAFKTTAKHDWKRAKNAMTWFGHKMHSWELQVLMGFPGDHEFHGNYAQRCRQVGNAVCPPVARWIAGLILKAEDNSRPPLVAQSRLERYVLEGQVE